MTDYRHFKFHDDYTCAENKKEAISIFKKFYPRIPVKYLTEKTEEFFMRDKNSWGELIKN